MPAKRNNEDDPPAAEKPKTDANKTAVEENAASGVVINIVAAENAASGVENAAIVTVCQLQSKQVALMISAAQPFRPKAPSVEEIVAGRAQIVRIYMQGLQRHVLWKFSIFCHEDPVI